MLTHIAIRDFALIERLELDFGSGLTVLTGETSAGKSILIDALNLALGDRADSTVVRSGSERAEIRAVFGIGALPAVKHWLAEHDIEADDECLLRRAITQEGRSRGYINDNPVTLQSLQELGEMLVDIHGQHEHQSLLRTEMQRQMLDDYAGHAALLNAVAALYQRWKMAVKELAELERSTAQGRARGELLRHHVQELSALQLGASEWADLNEELSRLAHAGRLMDTCQNALDRLYEADEGALYSILTGLQKDLGAMQGLDHRLDPLTPLLEGAAIQIREAADELRRYLDKLDLDPQRLQSVEQRLGSIHDLGRKHHAAPEALPDLLVRLTQELTALQNSDQRQGELKELIAAHRSAYLERAEALRLGRAKAARTLSERVTAAMQQLNMAGGSFEVKLESLPEEQYSATGKERVEFLVSANPGQPLKPLNKIASGGELSRISLAIQVITAQNGRIPTLIFDEVDVGIGGAVAEIVGQQLQALSQTRQVLCVTHLPQVAAQGRHHLQVNKQTGKGVTRISLKELSSAERADEIARMLGGVKITEQTRSHAVEMLAQAQSKEQKLKKPRRNSGY
ncbi:MAG: DNA repair protein RecN [Gammaproteobacteria bacterium]|nr:DNA repair protein RecN [Gammaproteobacteria bacterium]